MTDISRIWGDSVFSDLKDSKKGVKNQRPVLLEDISYNTAYHSYKERIVICSEFLRSVKAQVIGINTRTLQFLAAPSVWFYNSRSLCYFELIKLTCKAINGLMMKLRTI